MKQLIKIIKCKLTVFLSVMMIGMLSMSGTDGFAGNPKKQRPFALRANIAPIEVITSLRSHSLLRGMASFCIISPAILRDRVVHSLRTSIGENTSLRNTKKHAVGFFFRKGWVIHGNNVTLQSKRKKAERWRKIQ